MVAQQGVVCRAASGVKLIRARDAPVVAAVVYILSSLGSGCHTTAASAHQSPAKLCDITWLLLRGHSISCVPGGGGVLACLVLSRKTSRQPPIPPIPPMCVGAEGVRGVAGRGCGTRVLACLVLG